MVTKKAIVIKSTGSWYTVLAEPDEIFHCKIRGKLRIKGIKTTNPIAVGDSIEFELPDNELNGEQSIGIIKSVDPRKNYIIRKSINLSKEAHILAANVDQAILVVTLKEPHTTTTFIDRFLASSEAYNIPTVLIFNKIDFYSPDEHIQVEKLFQLYQRIGYACIKTSIISGEGLSNLQAILKNKISVISGHSGVGKSSLINKLDENLRLKTGNISDYHKQGKHITTFSEMFRLEFGGYIIDTPGIRGFGLIDMDQNEVYHFFKEIFTFSHQCRFNNCTHTHEPGCAVVDAVKHGDIAYSRYESYLNIIFNEDDKYRQGL